MRISTIENHEAGIARARADNARRIDQQLDVSDCALSSWADTNIQTAHRVAIEALELGAAYGYDFPVARERVLCRGDEIVSRRRIKSKFYGGTDSWLVKGVEGVDRTFIPVGDNSRIQKQYGLSERYILVEADRELDGACAGLGCPVFYFAKAKRGAEPLCFEE